MTAHSAKRILIAPLDWGLGHTTRCIPIIRRLLANKCEVLFAGNDAQQTFIRRIFPGLSCHDLVGYNVSYGRSSLFRALTAQLPRLIWKVSTEHQWLLAFVASKQVDGIISDNRYGLWHPKIPSVILTHQAQIRTGIGGLADRVLRRIHYKFLERFTQCWLVDTCGSENLAGQLSHPSRLPRNSQYIGWLSQLLPTMRQAYDQHVLILLSGPEPQRSMLSDLLWRQALKSGRSMAFVEGKASAVRENIPANIKYHAQVSGDKLQELLANASLVICRSGYSTLMDLVLMKKKAILIPTPGQTEQEYLAKSLSERGIFMAVSQNDFSLQAALEEAISFPFEIPEIPGGHELFGTVLDRWLNDIAACPENH